MGSFSTLKVGETLYQFKTGFDYDMGTYEVGDTIPWRPNKFLPGVHIDGVCDVDAVEGDPRNAVVIKDCKIVDFIHIPWERSYVIPLVLQHYGIKVPDPNLWTMEQWARKAISDQWSKHRSYVEDAELFGLSDRDAAVKRSSRYIRRRLKEPGFLRSITQKEVLKARPVIAGDIQQILASKHMDLPELEEKEVNAPYAPIEWAAFPKPAEPPKFEDLPSDGNPEPSVTGGLLSEEFMQRLKEGQGAPRAWKPADFKADPADVVSDYKSIEADLIARFDDVRHLLEISPNVAASVTKTKMNISIHNVECVVTVGVAAKHMFKDLPSFTRREEDPTK